MNSSFRVIDPFLIRPLVVDFNDLPREMKSIAYAISQINDRETAVRYAYDTLSKKYRGSRLFTFLRFDRFFITDISKLWNINGFLHCNHMNYLLRTLLIASGKFLAEDIRIRWTHIWYLSPHQYLDIKLGNGSNLLVDLWGKVSGVPFGSYARGFQNESTLVKTRER